MARLGAGTEEGQAGGVEEACEAGAVIPVGRMAREEVIEIVGEDPPSRRLVEGVVEREQGLAMIGDALRCAGEPADAARRDAEGTPAPGAEGPPGPVAGEPREGEERQGSGAGGTHQKQARIAGADLTIGTHVAAGILSGGRQDFA